MDIEFLDWDYEAVELGGSDLPDDNDPALAAAGDDGYLGWFIDRSGTAAAASLSA